MDRTAQFGRWGKACLVASFQRRLNFPLDSAEVTPIDRDRHITRDGSAAKRAALEAKKGRWRDDALRDRSRSQRRRAPKPADGVFRKGYVILKDCEQRPRIR